MPGIVYPTTGTVGAGVGQDRGNHVHAGTDIRTPIGTDVVSSRDGTVTRVTDSGGSGYGKAIYVQNDDGTTSVYGHLSDQGVSVGDKVSAGDSIGASGNSGHSTGPHLHYEVRDENGKPLKDQYGDNSDMNDAMRQRGTQINAGKDANGNGPGSQKGDSKSAKNDDTDSGKKDREDTTEANKKKGQESKPPEPKKHDDIKGEPGKYKQVQTASIVGRLPTHEPWPYHPKSIKGPRQGIQRADQGNNSGAPDTQGGGGGGGGNAGGGGNSGTSSSPNGGNAANATSGLTPNLDNSTDRAKAESIIRGAKELGVDPGNLAMIIGYESAGSFSPSKAGGMNKDGSGRGSFLGLIQFSPAMQRKYGVSAGQTFDQQMDSVVAYMKGAGVKPGASLLQMYSSVNAGRAGSGDPSDPLYQRSDVNGNQLQHVQNITNKNGRAYKSAAKIMGALQGGPERSDKGMNPATMNSAPSPASTTGKQTDSDKSGSTDKPSDSGSSDTTDGAKDSSPKPGAVATGASNQGGPTPDQKDQGGGGGSGEGQGGGNGDQTPALVVKVKIPSNQGSGVSTTPDS